MRLGQLVANPELQVVALAIVGVGRGEPRIAAHLERVDGRLPECHEPQAIAAGRHFGTLKPSAPEDQPLEALGIHLAQIPGEAIDASLGGQRRRCAATARLPFASSSSSLGLRAVVGVALARERAHRAPARIEDLELDLFVVARRAREAVIDPRPGRGIEPLAPRVTRRSAEAVRGLGMEEV